MSELTTALRARGGTRQSQKALPEQEVLAVLIWLAGDPKDAATIQRLGRASPRPLLRGRSRHVGQ
ncbi:MAG: hypothetical protein ACJ780_10575 [Solirubrobacteraceae bacterium]